MLEIMHRPIEPGDETFLYALYASTREPEMALTNWSDAQKESFLQMQYHAQSTDYARNYPDAQFDLVLCDGCSAGRLYLDRRENEIRIIDIALFPSFRNRGIGSKLLSEVMTEAAAAGKRVCIHVEQNNPAQRLYRRLGFVPVGENGVYFLMEWKPNAAVSAT